MQESKGSGMVFALMVALLELMICLAAPFSQGEAILQGLPAAEQVDALLHFKTLLSPHSQVLLDGWHASHARNVCTSWVGVHCTVAPPPASNTHINIYSINLSGLGLSGMLAPQIGNLSSVSVLDLSNNSLSGSIPEQLSSCTSLTLLNLGANSFHGAIPSSLSSLSSLQNLNLSHNHLSGDIPHHLLTNCTSLFDVHLHHNSLRGSIPTQIVSPLRVLDLHDNNFTGLIPPALGNCTSLVDLILYANQLNGPIPSELGLLHSLQCIPFSDNHLTGAIPRSLANCSSLTDLSLDSNLLTGSIPRSLANCSSLTVLSLDSNLLTGSIPLELGSLGNLQELYLRNQNNLTGAIPLSLGNCFSLTILSLGGNHLTGPVPSQLGLLSHLHLLDLSENHLSGAVPRSLGNCTSLAILQMGSNQLSGSIPTELTRMSRLETLFLLVNHLSGSLSLTFSNFSSLYTLNLGSNQLTGPIPEELGHMEKLQTVGLSNNSFSGVIPWPALSNCSSLYVLDLSSNHLTGAGFPNNPGRLQALRELFLQQNLLEGATPQVVQGFNYFGMSLIHLDVSSNRLNGSLPSSLVSNTIIFLGMDNNDFSGPLPPWLGVLVQVQSMSLAYNHFMGTIPESLGQCLALTSLDLSHNHLTGDIPQLLINLTYLENLDVSSNNLTGILPPFLENFTHLQVLDVSFNNFTGTIPRLGVFEHLNASSFQGNPELCGTVMIKKACGRSSKTQHHHSARQLSWKTILPIALASSLLGATFILALCHYLKCIQRFRGSVSQTRESASWLQEVKRYTAEELTQATQGYSEGNLLGQGALAQVYKGVLPNGKFVAVKKFREVCFREALLQEVKILSKLRHRNLVRVLGCVLNLDINALVLEYMSNGNLEQYLHPVEDANESHELGWRVLLDITTGVANALAYLHHEFGIPIIHGDVKPDNILLDSSLEAHLADFGLAKLANNGVFSVSSSFKGSIGYMAPEYAYTTRITTKVDVYSFGVVILEMLTGRRPTSQLSGSMNLHEWVKMKLLDGVGLEEVLHANSQAPLLPSATNTDGGDVMQLIKLGLACTQDQPNRRPTMQEVVTLLHNMTMS